MNANLSKYFRFISVTILISMLLASCASAASVVTSGDVAHEMQPMTLSEASASTKPAGKIDPLAFQQAVRKLWEDHITWTRVYIIATFADLPEADAAAGRLLQNQVDLGNAIKPFYGDAGGNQLTALLTDHILIAVDLLNAAKAGDNAAFEAAIKKWYDNANQIASFLNSANPKNWSLDEMQKMMKAHLDLTLEEATARLNGDWAGDVIAYDKVHAEILDMADMLATGIISQFPSKFARPFASEAEIKLTLAMDKLWEDHVTWTRMYIISVTSDLPDADAAAGRLLQNQVDIGNAIKPFYGKQAGEQLTSLLKEHILIAVDILAAAKAGDQSMFESAKARWYENGDEIAAFLNNANPDNWSLSDMQAMMKAHLDLTLDEATARFNADWSADVAAYDKVHDEILQMAGMLSQGLIAQFPDKFK